MKRWFGAKAPVLSNSNASKSLNALDEPHALQQAMAAAQHIMNDDVDAAEEELSKGHSPFHKLGRGTTLFLRATLGFEKDVMAQAGERLAEAEESSWEHQRRAIRDPSTAYQSEIYPVGSEYALLNAQSQIMGALIGVLNESLTESLRGFYKLRKAFATLQEISEAEKRFLQRQKGKSTTSLKSLSRKSTDTRSQTSGATKGAQAVASGAATTVPAEKPPPPYEEDEDDDLEFVDAEEARSEQPKEQYQGHTETPDIARLSLAEKEGKDANFSPQAPLQPPGATLGSKSAADRAEQEPDIREFTSSQIDLFIHSGSSLWYGLLQLMLSMIPPAFGKLLSLFSFRGDRENGLRLLWQATKHKENINGAMAGLITLGFHNGAIAFCDIITEDALPQDRLRGLLHEMRELYPKSMLWQLEEARMLSAERKLPEAVELASRGGKSSLKQVEALRHFERSLNHMYLHHYQTCADSFIECVNLNSWSHALYYYIAGSCHLELYRTLQPTDPSTAAKHAAEAESLLRTCPQHIGKKKFMARQLPFDTFVARKLAKWEARAKDRNVPLVDAIGLSPLQEMTYFWNGYKRMSPDLLRTSLDRLDWSTTQPTWPSEPNDEHTALSVLRATCLRELGEVEPAMQELQTGALTHELWQLKQCPYPETWALAVANYELAVCFWQRAGGEGGDPADLEACSQWLAKIEGWEKFDLDARLGLKVTTARETLKRCGVGPGL
ncbi:hypothetical protein MBLNU230_g4913t1 [Neophaeotheca triangularis]